MATAKAPEAISIFRSLLRMRKKCFAGDTEMLTAVAAQIRNEFEAHKDVTDEARLGELLTKALEAVEFMGSNIVQAKLNDRGNYEMKLRPEHSGANNGGSPSREGGWFRLLNLAITSGLSLALHRTFHIE